MDTYLITKQLNIYHYITVHSVNVIQKLYQRLDWKL